MTPPPASRRTVLQCYSARVYLHSFSAFGSTVPVGLGTSNGSQDCVSCRKSPQGQSALHPSYVPPSWMLPRKSNRSCSNWDDRRSSRLCPQENVFFVLSVSKAVAELSLVATRPSGQQQQQQQQMLGCWFRYSHASEPVNRTPAVKQGHTPSPPGATFCPWSGIHFVRPLGYPGRTDPSRYFAKHPGSCASPGCVVAPIEDC